MRPPARPPLLAAVLLLVAAGASAKPVLDHQPSWASHRAFTVDALGGKGGFDHDPLGHRSRSGATHLHHQFDGLLLAARTEGVDEPFLRFRYDPLGRRVAETAHGLTTLRLPFGDQVVQESLRSPSGTVTPRKRLYWGDGIDALVAYHFDPVGAGHLGAIYFALTDPQGTVHALADAQGRVVESYLYRGDGTFTIFGGDTTPPALVLARLRDDHRLELAFSEPVQAREDAFALTAQGAPLDVEVVADADLRVWTLTASLVPGMDLALALTGIADLAGNPLPDQELNAVVPAPGEGVILFAAPLARVLAVLDGPGQVAVVLGAAVDPDTVPGSLELACDGAPVPGQVSLAEVGQERLVLWSATGDYPGAICTVAIGSGLRTAGGQSYAGPATVTYTPFQEGDVVWSDLHESPILTASQVGNDRFQHARPFIASLGLYDHRARFFDPATGTFLGPDPLGPVDSPNLYQAFGMDGVNVTDPFGECQWTDWECWNWVRKDLQGRAAEAVSGVIGATGRYVRRAVASRLDRSLPLAPDPSDDPYGDAETYGAIGLSGQAPRERAATAFGEVRQGAIDVTSEAAGIAADFGEVYAAQGVIRVAGGVMARSGKGSAATGGGPRLSTQGTRFEGAKVRPAAIRQGRFVRESLPELRGSFADAFDGPVRSRTLRAGDRLYRSPNLNHQGVLESVQTPGSWWGTRRTVTRVGTESQYNVVKWDNPLREMRTYVLTEDVTVYYGKVAGGKGYQVLIPRDVDPASVLRFLEGTPLR